MRLAAILATTIAFGPSLALAADYFPSQPEPAQAEPVSFNWGGIYGGIHAGYSHTTVSPSNKEASLAFSPSGLQFSPSTSGTMASDQPSYGGFIGVNYMMDDTVLGLEADYTSYFGRNRPSLSVPFTTTTFAPYGTVGVVGTQYMSINDLLLLKARGGWAMGRFLPFVSFGLALAQAHLGTYYSFNGASGNRLIDYNGRRKSSVVAGATVGLGVDYALLDNVFLRAEYSYVGFADYADAKARIHNVKAGVALKY